MMSYSNLLMILVFLTIALFGASMAAHHKIGDSAGWTAAGTVDYAKWAFSNNFQVGDQLDFKYDHHFHNIMEVSRKDFESCNTSSPILTYTTGHDSVELTSAGHHYFLCGIPGHCDAGQKVDIVVRDHHHDCCPNTSPPDHHSSASSSTTFLSYSSGFLAYTLLLIHFCLVFL